MEKLKAVKTMRLTGKMTVGPGTRRLSSWSEAAQNMRMEFTLQHDRRANLRRHHAWMVMPSRAKDPEVIPPGEARMPRRRPASTVLCRLRPEGPQVAFMGKDKVEGTDA
jgi:hypothetical protein